jgi:hypothetical protein
MIIAMVTVLGAIIGGVIFLSAQAHDVEAQSIDVPLQSVEPSVPIPLRAPPPPEFHLITIRITEPGSEEVECVVDAEEPGNITSTCRCDQIWKVFTGPGVTTNSFQLLNFYEKFCGKVKYTVSK